MVNCPPKYYIHAHVFFNQKILYIEKIFVLVVTNLLKEVYCKLLTLIWELRVKIPGNSSSEFGQRAFSCSGNPAVQISWVAQLNLY